MKSILLVLIIAVAVDAVPELSACPGVPPPNAADISISKCKKLPCPLKRNTKIFLDYKFTPDNAVTRLTNDVYASIFGVRVPFFGVDNTDACENVYTTAGKKLNCPLKAGQQYWYRNTINILEIYPTISVDVHWALRDQNNKSVLCFEVPAKIT